MIKLLFLGFLLSSCIGFNTVKRGNYIESPLPEEKIPFEYVNGLIVIDAEINGQTGRFLVDNGFTLSAVRPSFAKRANISFDSDTGVRDANNKKANLSEGTVDTVKIGQHVFAKTGFYKIDTKKFFPCDDLDGVIGASIINKANWLFRTENQNLSIQQVPFHFSGVSVPLKFTGNNSAFIDIEVNQIDYHIKVDMGNHTEISLRKSMALKSFKGEEFIEHIGISSLSATGLGNVETQYLSMDFHEVKSGDSSLPAPCRVKLKEKMKYDGYIGMTYLKRMDFVFHPGQKVMILGQPHGNDSIVDEGYGLSIYLVDGEFKIIRRIGGDTLTKDVELMDKVVSINASPIGDFEGLCAVRSLIKALKQEKEDLILELENGKIRRLPLRPTATIRIK